MALRFIVVGVSLIFLLILGWRSRNTDGFQTLAYLVMGAPAMTETESKAEPSHDVEVDASLQKETEKYQAKVQKFMASGSSRGMRKCKVGSKTVYTEAPCPNGSNEHTIRSGTIIVMEGNRNEADSNKPASINEFEELSSNTREPSIREKRMQQIINQH